MYQATNPSQLQTVRAKTARLTAAAQEEATASRAAAASATSSIMRIPCTATPTGIHGSSTQSLIFKKPRQIEAMERANKGIRHISALKVAKYNFRVAHLAADNLLLTSN